MEASFFIGAFILSVIAVNLVVWLFIYKKDPEPIDPRMKQILKLIREFEKRRGTLLEIHEINPDDVFLRKRGGL